MWDLVKVAIRNVGRNKRRSLITIITVFIGVVVATGTRGLLNGLQGEIRSSLTRKMHGDLQIHRVGYQDSLESNPYKMLVPFGAERASALKEHGPVTDVAPRLRVMGLLNHQQSQTTTPVMINAIDSARELAVCPRLAEALRDGSILDSSKEAWGAAAADDDLGEAGGLAADGAAPKAMADGPRAGGYHQIMVTPSLMRGLGAKLGDEIVILFVDKDNMQQALVAHVTGVVDYGMPTASARMAWMDFTTLQKVLGLSGQASELALATREGVPLDEAKAAVEATLPKDEVVETYLELAGFLRDALGLQDVIFTAVLTIVFTIVVAAIVNTSLMTVMERTREIGTLMALGYRRRHILALFLGEFAVIGMTGAVVGIVVATAGVMLARARGIPFKLPGQTVATVLFPEVSVAFLVLVFALAVVAALLAGILPAYRASRLRPVQALATA